MLTKFKLAIARKITNLVKLALDDEEVQQRLLKLAHRAIDDEAMRKKLWRAGNVRPLSWDTHWAVIPNDIREELMRQATRDTAEFVNAEMAHLEGQMDPFHLIEYCLDKVRLEGLYLEFGVFSGTTINHIASKVAGVVHGFDSFQGLPEKWEGVPAGKFSTDGRLPEVRENVRLHVGWFQDTLPEFVKDQRGPVAFLHVDSDLYSSAKTVLWGLASQIVPGTVIVFDEYMNYPHWREHEYKAFMEFVAEFGVGYEYIGYAARGFSAGVLITTKQ